MARCWCGAERAAVPGVVGDVHQQLGAAGREAAHHVREDRLVADGRAERVAVDRRRSRARRPGVKSATWSTSLAAKRPPTVSSGCIGHVLAEGHQADLVVAQDEAAGRVEHLRAHEHAVRAAGHVARGRRCRTAGGSACAAPGRAAARPPAGCGRRGTGTADSGHTTSRAPCVGRLLGERRRGGRCSARPAPGPTSRPAGSRPAPGRRALDPPGRADRLRERRGAVRARPRQQQPRPARPRRAARARGSFSSARYASTADDAATSDRHAVHGAEARDLDERRGSRAGCSRAGTRRSGTACARAGSRSPPRRRARAAARGGPKRAQPAPDQPARTATGRGRAPGTAGPSRASPTSERQAAELHDHRARSSRRGPSTTRRP